MEGKENEDINKRKEFFLPPVSSESQMEKRMQYSDKIRRDKRMSVISRKRLIGGDMRSLNLSPSQSGIKSENELSEKISQQNIEMLQQLIKEFIETNFQKISQNQNLLIEIESIKKILESSTNLVNNEQVIFFYFPGLILDLEPGKRAPQIFDEVLVRHSRVR